MGSRSLSPRSGCERHLFRRTAWQFSLHSVMSVDGIKHDHRDLASPLSGNLIASPGQIDAVSRSGRLQTIEPWQAGPLETMPPSSAHMLLSSFTTPVRFVHPNKGSNFVLLVERGGGPVFDVGTENRFGTIIFERNFPYAASMCMKAMIDFAAGLRHARARTTLRRTSQFAGALKKVNATWLVVGDPSDPDDCGQAACLSASGAGAPRSVIPASPSALAVCRAAS